MEVARADVLSSRLSSDRPCEAARVWISDLLGLLYAKRRFDATRSAGDRALALVVIEDLRREFFREAAPPRPVRRA
jgi:hypothetical protein